MLEVERLDLGGVGAVGVHGSVSMIGQSSERDLSKRFREGRSQLTGGKPTLAINCLNSGLEWRFLKAGSRAAERVFSACWS